MKFVIQRGAQKQPVINQPPNLLFKVERAGDRLVNKAAQFISNQATNLTKCFMSVQAKTENGKQINRIQSRSFEHRCMTAGLSLTLGPTWAVDTCTWNHLFTTPSPISEKYANQRKQKHEKNTAKKATLTYRHARLLKKYHLKPLIADKDYGSDATASNLLHPPPVDI